MEQFKKFATPAQLMYFSENGESMSDAQSMKGKCTQISEDIKAHFESTGATMEVLHFDGKEIKLNNPLQLDPKKIDELAGKDAEVNALNGWYARAIEAKNHLMSVIKTANWTYFCEGDEAFEGEQYPEKFDEQRPSLVELTEEDILGRWSANEVADFLKKEQYCATIGKLIHRKGKLHEIYNTPLSEGSKMVEMAAGTGGKKAYPVTLDPVYKGENLKAVKEVYLKKHDEHREVEKKVNWYKAKLKNELTEANAEAQKEYGDKLAAFNKLHNEYRDKASEYVTKTRQKNEELRAKCEERRTRLVKEASALKIFIPETLRAVKDFVQSYKVV